jgi:hypothetical protein
MNMVNTRSSKRLSTKSGNFSVGYTLKWDDTNGVGNINHRVLLGFTKSKGTSSTTYQISLFKLRIFLIRMNNGN